MKPQSELARYAFGYTDKKPGTIFWLIIAIIVLVDVIGFMAIRN